MAYPAGRHFLQIPGPTNVPDRVLRAMAAPIIDHRSSDAAKLAKTCLEGMKAVFQTQSPVVIFPASGTGAWEAALVNTLSPGDRILAFETGHFASEFDCGRLAAWSGCGRSRRETGGGPNSGNQGRHGGSQ
jgi:alanine-glyoxylate transaminase/serine-glyoxylate transaminase/serine-pyruvate transaminase